MRRTKEDAQHTREALLDAAELLFFQRGVSRTSLQEIAKAAGVTRGAIYWHFKDKAELFNAMMARTASPMEAPLLALSESPAPTLEAFKRSALAALTHIAHDPRTRRVFDIATQKVEHVDDLLGVRERHIERHQDWKELLEAVFLKTQAQGELPAHLDIHVVTMTYQAMISGLVNRWLLEPSHFDLVQMGEQCIDLFLNGLRHARPG